jgi:hypothetical protein
LAYNDFLQNNQQSTALDSSVAAALNGAVVGGPTLLMSNVEQGTLSARCNFLAQTTSLTLSAVWEVSDDGSTWRRATGVANASAVAIATGTAGVDTAVTRQIDAPSAVYGSRYARCSVLLGGANGAAGDQATVAYDYVRNRDVF